MPSLFLLTSLLALAPQGEINTPARSVPPPSAGSKPAALPLPSRQEPANGAERKASAGWIALRSAISKRLENDRDRLQKELDSYQADLGLEYSEGNKKYLDGVFDKLAAMDPDLGGLLLPLIASSGQRGVGRNRAENAVRILERMDLGPLEAAILAMVAGKNQRARMRALHLITGFRKTKLEALLRRMLQETPEAYLPDLMASIGRYGDPTLARDVETFLKRPNLEQRIAALEALAMLAQPSSINPVLAATRKIAKPQAWQALLDLLVSSKEAIKAQERLRTPELEGFIEATRYLLVDGNKLARRAMIQVIRSLAGIPSAKLRHDAAKLRAALKPLLESPYTDVQFEAAKTLEYIGDPSGIRTVLDRLNRFVRKNRRVPYAFAQRAKAHEAFEKLSDAIKDLKEAIRLSGKGRTDPQLFFDAARVEAKRGNATGVANYLKKANPTADELTKFYRSTAGIEELLRRSSALRKLFSR